jgi:hypothetical protein
MLSIKIPATFEIPKKELLLINKQASSHYIQWEYYSKSTSKK